MITSLYNKVWEFATGLQSFFVKSLIKYGRKQYDTN